MSANQLSSFFTIEINHKRTKQSFDFSDTFIDVKFQNRILELRIESSNEIIWNSEFLHLKELFKKIIPIAIDKSIEYITVTKENRIGFDINNDYFEVDYIEIIEDNRNLKVNNLIDFKIEVGLDSCDENGNLLTPYDACGMCCVTFEIDNLDEIKLIEIE